jgi:hypothetical protein
MAITQEEQLTERELLNAQAKWLRARGWEQLGGVCSTLTGLHRWRHHSAPKDAPALRMGDAIAFTQAEPLRYRRRR